MKRILLLMILASFATTLSFAQATYYWVGGNISATSLSGANWSLTPGGTGVTRNNVGDVLIFDGATVTFTIGSGTTVGKLQLQNGADVSFNRNAATGSSTFTVDNGSNNALEIKGGSKLRVIDGTGGNFIFALAANSTASVDNSEVYIQGAAWSSTSLGGQRIQVPTVGAFVFSNGSKCYVNVINQYPLSSISGSAAKAFIFNSGTALIYQGGRSPFGDTSTGYVADMKLGSDYILEANNSLNGLFNGKSFGNVIVRNNAVISLNENFSNIHNLTVQSGSSFLLRSSGVSPFSGNIVNNGTFGVAPAVTSSQLLMIGTVAQSISGSGTFTDFGAISVGADANVTLSHSLNLTGTSTSSVSGILDFSTYAVTGTGDFAFRQKYSITNSAATVNINSAVITLPALDYPNAGVALGVLVQGPQIPANSYIIGTNSAANQFTISNAATGNGSVVTLVTKPKLVTANAAGIDGSVQTSNSKSFGTDVNYIFNAATNTPFTSAGNNPIGDVTFNAAATTNKDITINGKLTLNNAKLTVRESDNVTIATTGSFDGTFSSTAYVATEANTTTGVVGTLKVNGISSSTLIPVGTTTQYTPVTLVPAAASNFDINVFAGATADATPNGTALTAAQKLRMVDAVWNINRTSGAGNVEVTLAWNNAQEGTDFAGFANAQIGVAGYTSGAYGSFTGTGNAAANTATLTTSLVSPFIVGEASTLPLTLLSFTAKESLNSVKLAWQTTSEVNLKNYVLQHKTANGFADIYTVAANNKAGIFNYNYTHLNPTAGVNYYRLVGVDNDGTTHVSEPKSVIVTLANAVTVYPNPVTKTSVSVSGVVSGDIIKILNIQGQVIATQKANGSEVQEINVQNIQSGTYILSIENSGKITATKKLIKI